MIVMWWIRHCVVDYRHCELSYSHVTYDPLSRFTCTAMLLVVSLFLTLLVCINLARSEHGITSWDRDRRKLCDLFVIAAMLFRALYIVLKLTLHSNPRPCWFVCLKICSSCAAFRVSTGDNCSERGESSFLTLLI